MTTPPERYTAEQMLEAARNLTLDGFLPGIGVIAMLEQAASDVRDAERLDWLVRHRTMSIHGSDERGSWSVLDGSNGLTFVSRNKSTYREAIDTAMGVRDE